jgi:hypothetical protein
LQDADVVTARVAVPVTNPIVAEIVDNPAEIPLATPAALIVAALRFDEPQAIVLPFATTSPLTS